MGLKSARIARIENLPDDKREELEEKGIDSGFAIVEIRNPDLHEEIKPLGKGGIRGYLLCLGEFKNIPL